MNLPSTSPSAIMSPATATPFIKWVGGKRQLLSTLLRMLPAQFGNYLEPFVGGGALFFAVGPPRAELGDINKRLVATYEAVRDRPTAIVRELGAFTNNAAAYYATRRKLGEPASPELAAARFIYLNKTCFNGVYRENRRGEFNVPYGNNPDASFVDAANILACSGALQDATLRAGDFTWVASRAVAGDFVYFDPPYVRLSATSSFTQYHAHGFELADQVRLRDVALSLKRRGVHVLLSNSSAPLVYDLYGPHFEITEVAARRAVNSNGDKRGPVKELLLR